MYNDDSCYLKYVGAKYQSEAEICSYLSGLKDDPRNHAVTLLKQCNVPCTGGVLLLLKSGGITLDHYIPTGSIDAIKLLDIGRQYFEGVDFLHQNGIQHNDLKPANSVVDDAGQLTIIDFGLATRCRPNKKQDATDMRLDGRFVGTEDWTAPEVGSGKPYSAKRADMWAAGKVMFEFCTRIANIPGGTITANDAEFCKGLCEKLMEANPERRPPLEAVVAQIISYVKMQHA